MHRHFAGLVALLVASVAPASAQTHGDHARHASQHALTHAIDSLSTHRFEALTDGARIEIQATGLDSASVGAVRRHLGTIADALASGDWSATPFAHMSEVPGVAAILSGKDLIKYVYRDLPAGAELRLVASDAEVIRAIHVFVACGRHHHAAQHHGAHGTRDHVVHAAREHDDTHQACGHSGG
jgi:hypothetical protein